jgi:mycothiol synthase
MNHADAVDRLGRTTSLELFEEWLRQPNMRPEEDCWLAEARKQIVGMGTLVRELPIRRVVLDGVVHPDHRRKGIGQALLRHLLKRGRALAAEMAHVSVLAHQEEAQAFLQRQGFAVTHTQHLMRLPSRELSQEALPEGFSFSTLQPGQEVALTTLQNASFEGSWGFCPNTPEEISYRLRMKGCRPEGVPLILYRGAPVAYCWTRLVEAPEGPRVGIIWMIGSHPDYRGLGLGKAIVVQGIRHLAREGASRVELTVNTDNTPALQLYRSLGFESAGEIWWFEQPLVRER